MRTRRTGALIALTACLGACAATAERPAPATPGATVTQAAVAPPPRPVDFGAWRADFRARALAEGIDAATFDAAFAGVGPNPRVLELDRSQPEFTRPIWEYLEGAVSPARVASGRQKAAEFGRVLAAIEARHGVNAEAVLAIWGIESGFGANKGSLPVVQSLATLAYDGRRRAFGEEQLLAALRILASGEVGPAAMVGSWAGAMGHTQFIPTSYLAHAVDGTGDGRRDIWGPDPTDALASTANYLAAFGWRRGQPTVVEVRLPPGFDFRETAEDVARSAAEWRALGVEGVAGPLPDGDGIAIIVPAGARGPALATYPNFGVIRRYNNATSYALAVSLLAERIAGRPGRIEAAWPTADRPLSRTETIELQERLTALGHATGGADGIVGPMTRGAVRAFQAARGLTPDGYVSAALLAAVRAAGGG